MPVRTQARPPGGRIRPGMMAVDHYGRIFVVRSYNPGNRWFAGTWFRDAPRMGEIRYAQRHGVRATRRTRYERRENFRGWVIPDADLPTPAP